MCWNYAPHRRAVKSKTGWFGKRESYLAKCRKNAGCSSSPTGSSRRALKMRCREVEERYREQIEALFAAHRNSEAVGAS